MSCHIIVNESKRKPEATERQAAILAKLASSVPMIRLPEPPEKEIKKKLRGGFSYKGLGIL